MSANAPPARLLAAIALAAALAGCDVKTHDAGGNETAAIHFGDDDDNGADANDTDANDMAGDAPGKDSADRGVSIHVPGFSAKLALPGLALAGRTTDIDGIPLYPGTKLTGVNIAATAGANTPGSSDSGGRVVMAFSAPAAPAALLAYYRSAARKAGWQERPAAAGQQFAATKSDDDGKTAHLALALHDVAGGAAGRFTIDGD